MEKFFTTKVGLFRTLTFLEGLSLILLMLIAVPLKYIGGDPSWVKTLGPVHGLLFIGFCYMAYHIGHEQKWNWNKMAWKLLIATFIPFGTFYLDHKVLRHIPMK